MKLGNIARKDRYGMVDGPFGSNLPASLYTDSGIPVVRGVNLSLGQERFRDDNYVFVSDYTANRLKRSLCQPYDIIFTKKGTLGQTGIIPTDTNYSHFLLSSNQMKLSVNTEVADALYVYYFVSSQQSRQRIVMDAMTTGVPKINLTYLRNFLILLPSIHEQQKIAAILSSYDDLIENNKRRITLLEKMAEEIYREWFVRMRFPGHKNVKFVKNVPDNWKHEKLGELCSVIKRGVSPSYDDDSELLVINQRCIRDGNIDLSAAKGHKTRVPEEKWVQYGDALINSTGVGTLGRVSIVEHEPKKLTVDSHVTICRANKARVNSHYLAHSVKRLQGYFEYMATGAAGQVELNQGLISGIKFLVPQTELQCQFSELVSSLWEKRHALVLSQNILTSCRELLLGRLISGKLPVDSLDIQHPPSMQNEKDVDHAQLHL